jgi:hypothetical protein
MNDLEYFLATVLVSLIFNTPLIKKILNCSFKIMLLSYQLKTAV